MLLQQYMPGFCLFICLFLLLFSYFSQAYLCIFPLSTYLPNYLVLCSHCLPNTTYRTARSYTHSVLPTVRLVPKVSRSYFPPTTSACLDYCVICSACLHIWNSLWRTAEAPFNTSPRGCHPWTENAFGQSFFQHLYHKISHWVGRLWPVWHSFNFSMICPFIQLLYCCN